MINLKTLTASVVIAVLNCPLVSANSYYSNLALQLKLSKFNNNASLAIITITAELNLSSHARDTVLNSMKEWEVAFKKACPERDMEGVLIESELCNNFYRQHTDEYRDFIKSSNTKASEIFEMIYLAELQEEMGRTINNPYRY